LLKSGYFSLITSGAPRHPPLPPRCCLSAPAAAPPRPEPFFPNGSRVPSFHPPASLLPFCLGFFTRCAVGLRWSFFLLGWRFYVILLLDSRPAVPPPLSGCSDFIPHPLPIVAPPVNPVAPQGWSPTNFRSHISFSSHLSPGRTKLGTTLSKLLFPKHLSRGTIFVFGRSLNPFFVKRMGTCLPLFPRYSSSVRPHGYQIFPQNRAVFCSSCSILKTLAARCGDVESVFPGSFIPPNNKPVSAVFHFGFGAFSPFFHIIVILRSLVRFFAGNPF